MHLERRPEFHAIVDMQKGEHTITADLPDKVTVRRDYRALVGSMLDRACGPLLELLERDPSRAKALREQLCDAKLAFLFDDDGTFIVEQMKRLPETNDTLVIPRN